VPSAACHGQSDNTQQPAVLTNPREPSPSNASAQSVPVADNTLALTLALARARSPYVYLIHVDEIATNGKGGPDTVEVISKETGRTVYTWKVLRVYTAAWPVVAS